MIDTINSFNKTSTDISSKSIIYGGSSQANLPYYLNETTSLTAIQTILNYTRYKNPLVGIYHALGPNDLYPANYQHFRYNASANLTNLDAIINPDNITNPYYNNYTSISNI